MLSRLMKNKKLTELIKAKKIDGSVSLVIKENEKEYDNTKRKIKKITDDVNEVMKSIDEKKKEKSNIKLFDVKKRKELYKDIFELKAKSKDLKSEIESLEGLCKRHEDVCSAIKDEIEKQYFIYQENEIFVKAVEKIESRGIDLPATFYKKYIKYVNTYMNSEYSIKYGTKIVEPDVRDLVFIANVLKRDEELHGKETSSIEVAQKKDNIKVAKASKKATSPRKVVEELTSNKVVKMQKEEHSKANKNTAQRRSSKKEVVNQ